MTVSSAFTSADIEKAKVLSFDVFDTTLCRTWFAPRDVFRVLARQLRARGLATEAEDTIARLRHDLEGELRRQSPSGETTLAAIHARFAEALKLAPEAADQALQLELQIEHASIAPVGAVAEMIGRGAKAGLPHVYTTDTYFSSEMIRSLLAQAEAVAGPVFASSEVGASKRRGDIYARIGAERGTTAILHVGDKKNADVEAARAAGWMAHHFVEQKPNRYETSLRNAAWTDPLAGAAVAGAARAARLAAPAGTAGKPSVQSVGADIAGPMFAAFVGWCFSRAEKNRVEKLLFMARDGQIFTRLAEALSPALPASVPFSYAYASRQALYLPSIFALGDDAWNWLEERMEGRTYAAVLARFGLPPDVVSVPATTTIGGADVPALRELLRSPSVSARILAEASARRAAALAYFREEIGAARRIGFVDIGWKGRLQICLERILAADPDLSGVDVVGYYFSLNKSAVIRKTGKGEAFTPIDEVASPVLAEILASADHGSVKRYELDARGRAAATFDPGNPEAEAWGVSQLQEGAECFARNLVRNVEQGGIDLGRALAELAAPSLDSFRLFVRDPGPDEIGALGDIMHSDDSAHDSETSLAPPLSAGETIRFALFGSVGDGRRAPFWASAAIARSVDSPGLRRGLRFALDSREAAARYKKAVKGWVKGRLTNASGGRAAPSRGQTSRP